jgi:hypothetical protein
MRKYIIPYRSFDNTEWRIDIENDAYDGDWLQVQGQSEQAGILTYNGETDNPFAVIIDSTLEINIINEGQIDLNELQQSQDRQWKVKQYRNGVLYWYGYLITDGIQYPLQSYPHLTTLQAVCGLVMLNDIPYSLTELNGGRVPVNYFRDILYNNLGLQLPIRWVNNLQCTAFIGEDVFAGGVEWSVNNEGFYSYQSGQDGDNPGQIKSCLYILEGILKSNQCRIFQANGKWNIRRINDTVTGDIAYKQVEGLVELNVITGSANIKKQVGVSGYSFINEDQIVTNTPGIKSARVTYDANVRANILPNGSMDIADGEDPLYWGAYSSNNLLVELRDSLDGRTEGHSAFLWNSAFITDGYFTLKTDTSTLRNDGLPIDTQTMVKTINFGFMFSPQFGYPVDGSGFIVWDSQPFLIQVIFNVDEIRYYLNNFGFWQTDETYINITVEGLKLFDIARVDFNKFQNVIMPTPETQPVAGSTSDIQVLFVVKDNQIILIDNVYINIDRGNDVYESTLDSSTNTIVEDVNLDISSSFGGYQLSNFMTGWEASDTECFFREGLTGGTTLTGMTARSIMKFRYKSSKIFNGSINVRNSNWSFDEIYLIDSFGSSKFLPMPGTKYNTEKSEVFLVAMECRSDNSVIFTEKYYNSNDQPLSN